ncbi:hypothetical protein BKM30_26565 [Pseudomonas syringae pv. syringae]|nr:hypothetical protein BKM30_26565 [Pseudomonas syringae pv. syringae]
MVIFSARSLFSGSTVCTEPLPKLSVPIRMPRFWSCNAPATISDAEALPPLISTTRGTPSLASAGSAEKRNSELAIRPLV